jgi:acetolactate synthase I/II/III large subunit
MGSRTLHPETTAEAYLELLKDRGIDVFLGNAGTDFASLVEAFARFETEGGRGPRPLVVPHEFVAVSMAHGYYAAGGRPAAVMVHVNVGTGNAATAIITAARANVPILMSAGRTPITEEGLPGSRDLHIHWAQESFDQAAMLREYVKWDYELRTPTQLEAVVDRAVELMHAEPRGPVYLTLPREVLATRPGAVTITSPARRESRSDRFPDPARIDEAARILARAEHPIVLTACPDRSRRPRGPGRRRTRRGRRDGRDRCRGGRSSLHELLASARPASRLQPVGHDEPVARRR